MFAVATFRFGTENHMPLVAMLGNWSTWIAAAAWLAVAMGMASTFIIWLRRPKSA